jgi:hypothetical protein
MFRTDRRLEKSDGMDGFKTAVLQTLAIPRMPHRQCPASCTLRAQGFYWAYSPVVETPGSAVHSDHDEVGCIGA